MTGDREELGNYDSFRLGYRYCVSCGREHPISAMDGMWCIQCVSSSADDMAERVRQANRQAWAKFYLEHPEFKR